MPIKTEQKTWLGNSKAVTDSPPWTHTPQIFHTPAKDSSLFHCSEVFVWKLLQHALGWNLCHATQAAKKILKNADEILQKVFLWMVHCIKNENILSALIVNSDQTQLTYAQCCHLTYAEIGSKQISTIGNDEKQALTAFISLTNYGILLSFQAIYKSSSSLSLPFKKSPFYAEAVLTGFLFESSHTDTYWSIQGTMRNFINKILAPYFDQTIEPLGLPSDQCCLWQIDC